MPAKSSSHLKIIVGHDDLTVPFEGGGKVFSAIAESFPQADIFTSMGTKERLAEFSTRKVLTTFMQKLPLKRKLQLPLFMLYPLAFESLDLSDYDLVISSSSRFAHGVVTKPETTHICYMHSPGRMFWESERYFQDKPWLGRLLTPALSYLRLWDYTAAQRVDYFIANSQNIARKIKRYYGREAKVIYPFVDLSRFTELGEQQRESGDYFLIVTRLAPWKRVDLAVEAAKQAGVKLKVVGAGPDRRYLDKMAKEGKPGQIEILGGISDAKVNELYQNCRASIMTQEEDFGITSLEAQAVGKPVIAYGAGGALETVLEGKTGEFFKEQTPASLASVLEKFNSKKYRAEDCRENARLFSKERFQKEILKFVENTLNKK